MTRQLLRSSNRQHLISVTILSWCCIGMGGRKDWRIILEAANAAQTAYNINSQPSCTLPGAVWVKARDGRPPKNQTSRDNYWHFLRKNLNRPHMSTLFPHFSNGRQLEILRTAFTNIVMQYLCFNILGHKILSSPSLLLSPFVKPKA